MPYIDAGTTNTSKHSADNESIHVRCCSTQSRANFEEEDASKKENLEIVNSIKRSSEFSPNQLNLQQRVACDSHRQNGTDGAERESSADPGETFDIIKTLDNGSLDIGGDSSVQTVNEGTHVERDAHEEPLRGG